MERIEIMVRLAASDKGWEHLGAELADRADELIAEDAKRTAADAPPSPKAEGLQPLVVEQATHGGWNIHTPNRSHYFAIGGWRQYAGASSFGRQIGSFQTKAQAETTLVNAEGTRPDRPANVDAPRVKWRPASDNPTHSTPILMRGVKQSRCNGYAVGTWIVDTVEYSGAGYFDAARTAVVPTEWCYLSEIVS